MASDPARALLADDEMLAWALDAYESGTSIRYRRQAFYYMRDDFLPYVRAYLSSPSSDKPGEEKA